MEPGQRVLLSIELLEAEVIREVNEPITEERPADARSRGYLGE